MFNYLLKRLPSASWGTLQSVGVGTVSDAFSWCTVLAGVLTGEGNHPATSV